MGTTFEKLGEHEWRNGFQNMNARVNVTSESALLPLWSGCPPRRSSTGAEPTMFAGNMAGTSAPSNNTLEIDMFCRNVDRRTRPVSCQVTLCRTWNRCRGEMQARITSVSSHHTQTSQCKVTYHQMCLKPGTTEDKQHSKEMSWHSNPINKIEVRQQVCPEHECVTERDECECYFTTVVGSPTTPVIDGGRTHQVASNMAGTSEPSTKNFLRDVSCCNSRVAVICFLRILC